MPRFCFEFRNNEELVPDESGEDLKDLSEAHRFAVLLAGKTLCFAQLGADAGVELKGWYVEVIHDDKNDCRLAILFPNQRNLKVYQSVAVAAASAYGHRIRRDAETITGAPSYQGSM